MRASCTLMAVQNRERYVPSTMIRLYLGEWYESLSRMMAGRKGDDHFGLRSPRLVVKVENPFSTTLSTHPEAMSR